MPTIMSIMKNTSIKERCCLKNNNSAIFINIKVAAVQTAKKVATDSCFIDKDMKAILEIPKTI